MATRKKKTVADEGYSKLDEHTIWLNEYYKSLRKAGFTVDHALWLLASPESYPEWTKQITSLDITNHLEEEDED